MAGFAVGVWIVPFYRGAFPDEIGTQFALLKASVNGVAGAASALGGGALVDRLVATEPRARQWVPATGSVLAIPFWLATLYAPTLQLSLTALFLEYLVAECWFGPTVAALQRAAPVRLRGLSQGIFNTLTLAGNLAPLGIGLLLNDYGYQLAPTLAVLVPIFYASSAAAFVVAGEKANGKAATETELR
jgi:MFS family permease